MPERHFLCASLGTLAAALLVGLPLGALGAEVQRCPPETETLIAAG